MNKLRSLAVAALLALFGQQSVSAALPPFDQVSQGYTKVAVTGQQSPRGLFNLWSRSSDAQLLGELPKTFVGKQYFIALTVSSGDRYAGLQSGDWVVEWRRYDDRLALVAPNLDIRATGDAESRASVKRLFTDQVLLDIPILAMGPSGGPVIDLDSLLVGNATRFFGSSVRVTNSRISKLSSAKVFPDNVEIAFEIVGSAGRFQTIHYSFSEVPSVASGYKPRVADERVGYFTTAFSDLSKYTDDATRVRYINRWRLEKRDPSLRKSPPKDPIRFYVEHTAPVRYRRWIKAGVDYWNKAFEKVGIVDAIVIEYQDAVSKAHMEKDPEDVRYNFIRWLNNDIGTAIGPSRVHPMTGQILDADIVLTDGWIRHFNFNYEDLMPKIAMEGVSAETLAWLSRHPTWDPRVRMAPPEQANFLREKLAKEAYKPMAGFALAQADPTLLGDDEYDGLYGRVSQKNGVCMAASGRSLDLALTRMNWALTLIETEEAAKKKSKKKKADDEETESDKTDEDSDSEKPADEKGDEEGEEKSSEEEPKEEKEEADPAELLDGMPEWFVGPLLADLVAHEVGHTLGLRHNFKASALYTMDEINSEELKGKKVFTASVMDYSPINYRFESGTVQGDFAMIDIGPYDFWAIDYGYTFDEKRLPEILKRCNEPELQFATDEDTSGPDPLARRYDFSKDPLDYCAEQMRLINLYRERILTRFVKDGDSWAKARRGYELTLSLQTRAGSMMANWIGGAFVNRDKKGDPGNRAPVEVVPSEQQRAALAFVIENTFRDDAFGLNAELLERMSVDKWLDGGSQSSMSNEATWPIHDRILGVQSTALTWLMNPTTLRRVYDNEMRLPADQETLTLPEVLSSVSGEVWSEIEGDCPDGLTARKPMISSLRRNLQREHMQRLIDLILESSNDTAAFNAISNLARMELRSLASSVSASLERNKDKMDPYSRAHLAETVERVQRALEAGYTYGGAAARGPVMMMIGREEGTQD